MTRWLCILVLPLLLWSCSNYYATRSEVYGKVDLWLEQDEYGKIFSTLDKVKKDHPQYKQLQQRMPAIRESARAYEQRISAEALKLAQKHQWQQAMELYDRGLKKYPQSALLGNERQRFLTDRAEYLKYLDRKYLYDQAEWLLKALPRQEEITRTNPKDSDQHRLLKQLQGMAIHTEIQLGRYGFEAMESERYLLADRYISLAYTLYPRPEYQDALETIKRQGMRRIEQEEKESSPAKVVSKPRAKQPKQKLARYFEYFEEAYERKDWPEASDYLDQIKRIAPRHSKTLEAEERLSEQIDAYIMQQIKIGEHQYSQGEFELALKTWEAALPMQPDNEELNKHITRAKKVLKNLEELSGRSPSISFPVEGEPEKTAP